jgi:hypothetical protein
VERLRRDHLHARHSGDSVPKHPLQRLIRLITEEDGW